MVIAVVGLVPPHAIKSANEYNVPAPPPLQVAYLTVPILISLCTLQTEEEMLPVGEVILIVMVELADKYNITLLAGKCNVALFRIINLIGPRHERSRFAFIFSVVGLIPSPIYKIPALAKRGAVPQVREDALTVAPVMTCPIVLCGIPSTTATKRAVATINR